MDFELTSEQLELKKEVAHFAKVESADPNRNVEETESIFPWQLYRKMAQKGWLGILVPTCYGGQGKGAIEYSIIMEELSKELLITPQATVQTEKSILGAGTEEQKKKYLPNLANGTFLAAQAISEPDAGSSFKNMKTTATKKGDSFFIKGHKSHINLAREADVFALLAVTDKGLTEFLIDKNTGGIQFEKGNPIAGRSAPIYDIFLDCRIHENQLLGELGGGIHVFMLTFDLSRIGNASQFIGFARGILDLAVTHAKSRNVGNHRLTDFQGIQWIIAELAVDLELAKLARDKAAWMEDKGLEHNLETSVAKYFAGEAAEKIVCKSSSLLGSQACYYNSPYERYLREIKTLQVAGGTSEIMKNNIARRVLDSYVF